MVAPRSAGLAVVRLSPAPLDGNRAPEHPSPASLHVLVAHDLDELERKIIESELPG